MTFDDGPEPTVTPALLRLLRELDVRVTFFVLLTQCRRHPELLEAMVADGHEIALHGVDHRPITDLSYGEAVDYLTGARRELEERTGRLVRFYRPPYGWQTMLSCRAARKAGLEVVCWSSHGADWVDRDVESIVAEAMSGLSAGGVLLLHERCEALPGDEPLTTTFDRIDMTRRLVGQIRDRGWQPRSVGRMVARSRAYRTVWLLSRS